MTLVNPLGGLYSPTLLLPGQAGRRTYLRAVWACSISLRLRRSLQDGCGEGPLDWGLLSPPGHIKALGGWYICAVLLGASAGTGFRWGGDAPPPRLLARGGSSIGYSKTAG